ncbi:hypothetical protein F66182_11043 [Fusarium sp. NRRL 66182]|nr:hypothetical protein F66182_11043 [Fusarium sp. NRRL 66182]
MPPPPPAAPTAPIASVDGPAAISTTVPPSIPSPGDSGWEIVQRKKKGNISSDSPKKGPRFRGRLKDLGSFRPSPITKMSSAQGEGSMSRILSGSSDRNTTPTNAKEMLASFQKPNARKQVGDADQNEIQSAWTSPVISPPAATRPLAENQLPAPSQSAPSVWVNGTILLPNRGPKVP